MSQRGREKETMNITCSGRDFAGAGVLPVAHLSVLPWKYSAKRVVIIAVILFDRTSSAHGCVHTLWINSICSFYHFIVETMSLLFYWKCVYVCVYVITMCRRHACV